EENLYKEDGELTDAYKAKIKEYEKYVMETPMNNFLKEEFFKDKTDIEVIEGISDFARKRRQLIEDYEEEYRKNRNFDTVEWTERKSVENIQNEPEKEEVKQILSEILQTESIAMLEDADTNETIEDLLKASFHASDGLKDGEKWDNKEKGGVV
ncbi:MAG: hypothetical protein LUD15_06925, partial [Bacteroides sp.]|nr:hypothetical protein [Bacteroides sp.]